MSIDISLVRGVIDDVIVKPYCEYISELSISLGKKFKMVPRYEFDIPLVEIDSSIVDCVVIDIVYNINDIVNIKEILELYLRLLCIEDWEISIKAI